MHLVGAALTTATQTWLPELFERSVARPLQFGAHYWNLMPTHEGYLGGGVVMRPRDLLKVGQMWLDGGTWHGRRIVEASWVQASTSAHATISPATTGLDPDQFGEFYNAGEDGYAWHLSEIGPAQRPYRTYAATGNGGQILRVVPEPELVVVFTAGNYGQGGIWSRWPKEIVGGGILPALRN
jgi:CubicO group peptidase (beta-lactamase class C family)